MEQTLTESINTSISELDEPELHYDREYAAPHKRKIWVNCCKGTIDYLWSESVDGLFSELYYKDSILLKAMYVFEFQNWEKVADSKEALKNDKKKINIRQNTE